MTPDAARLITDTKILAKVNQAHREAFRQKWPGQIEHILRLTAERLQSGLSKTTTDPITNSQVAELSLALYHQYQIYREVVDDRS